MARKAVGEFRKQKVSSTETNRVLARHGSRKGPAQHRPAAISDTQNSNQLSLFD